MTVWLLINRSQKGHAGLGQKLGEQVVRDLDPVVNTAQDRRPPFRQLEKLVHGTAQKESPQLGGL